MWLPVGEADNTFEEVDNYDCLSAASCTRRQLFIRWRVVINFVSAVINNSRNEIVRESSSHAWIQNATTPYLTEISINFMPQRRKVVSLVNLCHQSFVCTRLLVYLVNSNQSIPIVLPPTVRSFAEILDDFKCSSSSYSREIFWWNVDLSRVPIIGCSEHHEFALLRKMS